jgi:LAO/AO transport system kinase
VVSKCDRSDANRTIVDLKQMLMIGHAREQPKWTVPVIATSAMADTGIDELTVAIEDHRAATVAEGGAERRLAIANFRLRKTAETLLLACFNGRLDELAPALTPQLAERKSDPYSLAHELITSLKAESEGARHERNVRSKMAR